MERKRNEKKNNKSRSLSGLHQINGNLFLDTKEGKKWGIRHPFFVFRQYLKDLRHCKKHGCVRAAQWDTAYWFIDIMREIIYNYRFFREGTAPIFPKYNKKEENKFSLCDTEDETEAHIKRWNDAFDYALEQLEIMKEIRSCEYDWRKIDNCRLEENKKKYEDAKEKFFAWLEANLEELWD